MVAPRCPTPSPAVEDAHSQMNVEASMEISADNPTAAATAAATDTTNSAATAKASIGIGSTGGTPEAARTLLGFAAQKTQTQVESTSTIMPLAQQQPTRSTTTGSDEENVCNYQTTMMDRDHPEEGNKTVTGSVSTSTKRPREEAGNDSEHHISDTVGNLQLDTTTEERPAKKHSPLGVVHRLLQHHHPGQDNDVTIKAKDQKEDKRNLEVVQEEEKDGYGPGGGFIGPTMGTDDEQQGRPTLYQPKRHQWPNHADDIAAAAAELDREERRMGGISSGGGTDDRFDLLDGDGNEILRGEDSIFSSKVGGQSSPANANDNDTDATEKYEESEDDDDASEQMEVVRPVPFRVPEKEPRYGFVHQLQQTQHRELEGQQPQVQQQQSHVRSSPTTTMSRPTTSRMLSSAPPLASSRHNDGEGRDDAMADSGDAAVERQRSQKQHRPESVNTVPRYGSGRAVVQPFGNSGVDTDNTGGYDGDGVGGGESYRGLSDTDAVFGDEDEDDLYHGSASFDQDGNYYGPAVPRGREEEKKDEDDASRIVAPTKLESMFVSAGSQMPIGVDLDVPGVGFVGSSGVGNESIMKSHDRIDLQARPQPKIKSKAGPRKKVARKTQRPGIGISSLENEEIVTRPRRTRDLRIPQKRIDIMLANANFRRNAEIAKKVEYVTAADIPTIVTSLIEPFFTVRRSRNLLLYLNCRDLAKASKISRNFHFWVQRETSRKALEFKERSSLAWEVVKGKRVYSADEVVKNNIDRTMKCATSLRGNDERWGSIPTHMDAIEKVVGWCGGWLQFLHARENGAKSQPRSPTDRNKTTLGIHQERGGVLPQAAVIFDLRCNGEWIWSGIRPISKGYLDRSTSKKDGLLRIYPFSENTRGEVTDLDSPAVLGSDEAKRAGCFLLSTPWNDRRMYTLSASIVSEVSTETRIHSVTFKPHFLCGSLYNGREFYAYGPDHWNIGEGSYYNERLVAGSEDGCLPEQCCIYVSPDQRLVTYCPMRKTVEVNEYIYFNNCFWLDSPSQNSNPSFHMMSELVCEKEVIYEMFLNTHH